MPQKYAKNTGTLRERVTEVMNADFLFNQPTHSDILSNLVAHNVIQRNSLVIRNDLVLV